MTAKPPRFGAIDVLRGLVIVFMVVDHARWFLSSYRGNPTDPAHTTTALFFTRWITHLCAPTFMLLAGAGSFFALGRGRDRAALSSFLLTRGLWLVLLELTVARFGWQFNLDYGYTGALVFWALGWSMVALAALVWLPTPAIAVIGGAMILLHNATDRMAPAAWGDWAWLWTVLHVPGEIHIGRAVLDINYPLVPWIGVMAMGFVFGAWFERLRDDPEKRDRSLVRCGLIITVAFVVLRLLNLYGDPHPCTSQVTAWRTFLSFLNTTKYPPSLLFLLMTLGPAIAVLPLLEQAHGRLIEGVRTIGRVPLFFWLLHVPLLHGIALLLSLFRYGRVVPWLVSNPPVGPPEGYGYGLGVVYLVTIAAVLMLYPLCARYATVKRNSSSRWLGYL